MEDQTQRLQTELFDNADVNRMRLEAIRAENLPHHPDMDPIQPLDEPQPISSDEEEELDSDFQTDMYASMHALQIGHDQLLTNQNTLMASQANLQQT